MIDLFAIKLKSLRTRSNRSTRDVAVRSGLSAQLIDALESGMEKPDWDMVRALADTFGVSTDYFRPGPIAPDELKMVTLPAEKLPENDQSMAEEPPPKPSFAELLVRELRKEVRKAEKRLGQEKFRANLLRAYEGRCAISSWEVEATLEAAHIIPYSLRKSQETTAGLLLKSDFHTLFDLDRLRIRPEAPEKLVIEIHPGLQGSPYSEYADDRTLRLPSRRADWPSFDDLRKRYTACVEMSGEF